MVFHLVPKKKEPARLKAKGVEDKALVNETAAQVSGIRKTTLLALGDGLRSHFAGCKD
jgi:hypothetical protein